MKRIVAMMGVLTIPVVLMVMGPWVVMQPGLVTAQLAEINRVYLPHVERSQPADPPVIGVQPESHDFGPVDLGQTTRMAFMVSNAGDAPLVVSALSFGEFSDPDFGGDPNFDIPVTLAPGDQAAFDVAFSPTTEGEHRAALSIFSNDPQRPSVSVSLLGLGTPGAAEKVDDPRQRQVYFHEVRATPGDVIPLGARVRAWEQLQSLRAGAPPGPRSAVEPTQVVTYTFRWESIGPRNVGAVGAGRVTAVAVDPAGVIYGGAALGGVFKSFDGGANWQSLMFHQPSLAVGSIAIDPANRTTVYVGTGEQNFALDSYYGAGVLKTTDGGALGDASWTNLGRAQFVFAAGGGATIGKMIVDTANSNQVYAATNLGFYRSTDAGVGWTQITSGIPASTVTDLAMDPTTSPVTLYAGVSGNGIYRSTDAGQNWTQLAGGLPAGASMGRIALAIAPSNTQILYAALENDNTGNLLGVYRTADGGANWASIGAPDFCGNQCWYDLVVGVDPTNANRVFLGGIGAQIATGSGMPLTWAFAMVNGLHADQHAIAWDPNNSMTVYVGNDGGLYRSTDAGLNFTRLDIGAITQHQGIAIHPVLPNFSSSGSQDNGSMQYTGDVVNWAAVGPGCDGGWTAISPSLVPPNEVYITTQSNGCARILRADSITGAFNGKTSGITIGTANYPDGSALFYAPLVIDPSNVTTLYYGSSFVYRTTDRGENWNYFPTTMQNLNGRVSTIAVAPSTPTTVYAGTACPRTGNGPCTGQPGRIWRTTATPANWVEVGDFSAACMPGQVCLPDRVVTRLAVHPTTATTVYATFSGFDSQGLGRPGHVFRSTDSGQTWTDITPRDRFNNRIDLPVNVIVIDPNAPSNLYIGTDIGVLYSPDDGATWQFLDAGMPDVAILDMAINPATGVVRAASHGRATFDLVREGAQLQVSKQIVTPASGTATPGDMVTYNITITNTGTVAITNLPLDDIFDNRYLRFVSATLPPTTVAPGLVEWDDLTGPPPDGIGRSLRTNESLTVTVTFQVIGCPTTSATVNKARVSGAIDENRDPVPTVSASAALGIACPAVAVTKTMVPMACWVAGVGDMVAFDITVTNTGNTTLTVLPLEDTYDTTYLSYLGATPNSDDNVDDGTVNWSDLTQVGPNGFGMDLAPGASFTVVVNFQTIASTQLLHPPETTDTATVVGATDGTAVASAASDSDAVEIADADLFATKAGPAEVMPGSLVTYTITFGNLGPDDATHVRLRDMLPAGASYVADTLGGANVMGTTVDWFLGTLPGGVSRTFQLTVQIGTGTLPGTMLIDEVWIESGQTMAGPTCGTPDSDPTNNHASVSSTVIADFGDAPDPWSGLAPPVAGRYPTLLMNNGAYHGNFTQEWLGASVNGETDAVFPDLFDDGAAIGSLQPSDPGRVSFQISTSGLGAVRYGPAHKLYLRGWIDFDQNGTWSDPGERVVDWSGGPGMWGSDGSFWPLTSFARSFLLEFNAPQVPAGFTWVRFRLSYDAPVGPTGPAPFGEVEDFEVMIGRVDP